MIKLYSWLRSENALLEFVRDSRTTAMPFAAKKYGKLWQSFIKLLFNRLYIYSTEQAERPEPSPPRRDAEPGNRGRQAH